jgi:Carboxypeptidase regulatory-like domain
MSPRKLGTILILFALLLFICGTGNAQVNTGSISGTVIDSSGAAIPNATVVVTNTSTGEARAAHTSDVGLYNVQGLLPGIYKVKISSPSFSSFEITLQVTVGSNLTANATLQVGKASTVVEVVGGGAVQVNTETQELSQLVDNSQLQQLPSLTRNPYDFVVLSGNVSNGDSTTTDMNSAQNMAARGVGYSINGQRESGTEILLDGVENIAVFGVSVGQLVPIDSIQEFNVLTNNFSAEYGRASGGVVNVDTKPGGNQYHGSLFEYNRLSAYTSNTFANAISDTPKGSYTRNQFGFNVGGPIIKNKLFLTYSQEFVRVRSSASISEDVFDPAFTSLMPSNISSYFSQFAANKFTPTATYTAGQLAAQGGFFASGVASDPAGVPLVNGITPIPDSTPVLDTISFKAPFDAGGGVPQNTYNLLARADYNFSDKTQMFFRYARYNETDFPGADFYSPYSQYDVGGLNDDDSYLFSFNHSFSTNFLSATKLSFTRFNSSQTFNNSLLHTPNLYLNTTNSQAADPISGNLIQMPGLENTTTGSGGLPFGGPQNTLQPGEGVSWTKGRHTMRFGGDFTYIQLNVGYGAYFQPIEALGSALPNAMNSFMNVGGSPNGPGNGGYESPVLQLTTRVDPAGALPCATNVYGEIIQTPACTVNPPLAAPSVERSYRYKDWDLYAMDSFRLNRRLTINYGLRYEHFGVQHNNIQSLDSNFYQGAVGSGPNGWAESVRDGQVLVTGQSPVGQFWANRWGTPAPRVGFAYDVMGDGKTSLRGGFGISYERNFGNVTYNASFNPPASAVVNFNCSANSSGVIGTSCPYYVSSLPTGSLGQAGPATGLPQVELRDNDAHINVAQTQFWSLGVDHQVFSNALLAISYSGAHSVHLYDLANINLAGAGNFYLGDPLVTGSDPATGVSCPWTDPLTGVATCYTRLNSQYSNINKRGSMGEGNYNGLNVKFQAQNIRRTGLTFIANYTYSHSLDDLSTTFSESLSNGSLGYTNYTHPQLDYASSDYDIRHRVVLSPIWETPWFNSGKGFLHQVAGGWNISGIFTIRTGIPFSMYDVSYLINYYDIPRVTFSGPITQYSVGKPVQSSPTSNFWTGLTLPPPANIGPLDPALDISDFGPYPANMSGRNIFHGPGAWYADMAVQKNFTLTERFGLQFRAEAFDIFNHHNFYVNNGFNYFAQGGAPGESAVGETPVTATEMKGGLGTFALGGNHDERRFGQFSLRLTF